MKRFIGVAFFAALVCYVSCQQQQPQAADPVQPQPQLVPQPQPQLVPQPQLAPQPPPAPQPALSNIFPSKNQGNSATNPGTIVPNQQNNLPPQGSPIPQQPPFPGQFPPQQNPNQDPNFPQFPGQLPNPQFPGQGPINQGQFFPGQRQGFPRIPNNVYPFLQQGPVPNPLGNSPFQQPPYAFQPNFNRFQQFNANPFPSLNPFSQLKDSSQFSKFLYCQVANGTMPDWTDGTCQKYWSCTNFNLTLKNCTGDLAYDYGTKECVDSATVQCQKQNVEFWQVLQGSMRGSPQPAPQFTPLSSLPGGRMNITLEAEACTLMGTNLPRLESVTNSALMNLSNCPFNNCNMTLINFICP